MIGTLLVRLAFTSIIVSTVAFYFARRRDRTYILQIARYSYQLTTTLVLSFSAMLVYFILTHQFQYTYVWSYSSTTLPTSLLLSTFYAGQEGSFSLWILYTTIVGVALMQYTSKRDYEPEVMFVWSSILSALLLMLIVKNPFVMIWETFATDLIKTGPLPEGLRNIVWLNDAKTQWAQIPIEGRGLNPLLQNYWMVIHPQILFSGFTSMAVPYAFAVAGLLRRDYQSWVRVAKPWSVFGAATLGTGIILGGYWAYETLGWGGYWGWDPVENSSLIPWLICIASIHTMMSQRRSGAFVKTNFALSILCFIMVLYSTFLTRSGVLGDTSVHSFVDPGRWAYWLLLGLILVFTSAGFGLLIMRSREMPRVPVEHSIYSREFALFLGAFTICFAALFITIGTSSPIITNILKGRVSAVDTAFYVKTTLPLGIVVSLLAGFGQLLWWKATNRKSFLRELRYPAFASLLFTLGLIIFAVRDIPMIIWAFASAFALFVNLFVGYKVFRGNPKYAGGAIAHIGVALLFLGFLSSARYDEKATVSLEPGREMTVLGDYHLTYVGNRQIGPEKWGFDIKVEHGSDVFSVTPVLRVNNQDNSTMRHPDIVNMYTKDFYVTPLSVEEAEEGGKKESISFLKGESREVAGLSVRFVDFDFSDMEKGRMLEGGGFTIGAILEVTQNGKSETIKPLMKNNGGEVEYTSAKSSFSELEFSIIKLQPNREEKSKSRVEIAVHDPSDHSIAKPERLVIEASIKPYINLVWMGTITLVVGFIITIIRRVQEATRKE